MRRAPSQRLSPVSHVRVRSSTRHRWEGRAGGRRRGGSAGRCRGRIRLPAGAEPLGEVAQAGKSPAADGRAGLHLDGDHAALGGFQDGVDLDLVLGAVMVQARRVRCDQVSCRASSISTKVSIMGPDGPPGRSRRRASTPSRLAAIPESTKASLGVPMARCADVPRPGRDPLDQEDLFQQGHVPVKVLAGSPASLPSALTTSSWPERPASKRIRARISVVRSMSDSWLTSRATRLAR